MTEQEFIGYSLKFIVSIIVGSIPLMTLIWKLCAKITTLIVKIDEVQNKDMQQDEILKEHSRKIEDVKNITLDNKVKLSEHEIKIKSLEKNTITSHC